MGNERALAGSVRRTAGAPLAQRVCNNFSLSALHFFFSLPDSISPFVCIFSRRFLLRSPSHRLAALSSPQFCPPPSILSTLRLSGLGVLKQNCGFINKSKAAQASALRVSSGRHTKAVMYQSSSHSFCKHRRTSSSLRQSHMIFPLSRIEQNRQTVK